MHTYKLKCFDCNKTTVLVELPEHLNDDQLKQIENGESDIQLTAEQALNDRDLNLTAAQKAEIAKDGAYTFNVAEVFDSCSACGTDQN